MGIVNVTPDSFSDGGQWFGADRAIAHGLDLVRQGADILDIGGESTRPGAEPVPVEEELRRVVPVVRELSKQTNVLLSIDTMKAVVARACLAEGAHIINDVAALRDPEMPSVAREFGAGVILMHMKGTPQTMQLDPRYDDVVREVREFFASRVAELQDLGLARETLMLDPGIGFGKKQAHTLEQLRRLPELLTLNLPICLGVSRKGFIGKVLNRPNEPATDRVVGSLAVLAHALAQKAAHVVRVHDVAATRDLVEMWQALEPQNG